MKNVIKYKIIEKTTDFPEYNSLLSSNILNHAACNTMRFIVGFLQPTATRGPPWYMNCTGYVLRQRILSF